MDEETGSTIAVDDEGGEMKNEGFTRLVTRLMLLPESTLSRSGACGMVADKGGDVCRGVATGEGKVGARGGGTIILEEDCKGCPLIAVLGALPTFKADCKHHEES